MTAPRRPKVLVALSTFAEHGEEPMRLLEASGMDFTLNPYGRRLLREEIVELGADCTGVIAGVEPYDEPVLSRMPKLRCISRCGVGTDNIDKEVAAARGVVVRNTPDVVTQPVAELALAMILDLLKRLTAQTKLMQAKRWEKLTGNLLAGTTVGVLGLGRIGRRVAESLSGLGADVAGCDRAPDLEWAERAGVRLLPREELLATSEVLTLHLSHDPEAPFIIGAEEIAKMPEGAFLVNVARGLFVDEDALYDALSSGRLAGAGLDVFPAEPYTGKLCDLGNVVLTPHVATLTYESRLQMEIEATQNLIEALS